MNDTSDHSRPAPAAESLRLRLPWLPLLVLGAATFTMVTAEMLPTALLPEMSAGLGVDEPAVGLLVSIWAAVVVIASFPLVRLTARLDRRNVIVGALVLLAGSSVLTATAPEYGGVAAGRVIGALAVGLLWATTNAHTADLVPDRLLPSAVAIVLGGATLGTVVGTSGASAVAVATDWRIAFGLLAVLSLVVALLVRLVVSPTPRAAVGPRTSDAAAPRRGPGRVITDPMVTVTALVALMLVGHYGAFTYITRLAEHPAQALPGGTATMLLVFGVASALGIALAGRFGGRTGLALLVSSIATALAVLSLAVVDGAPTALGVAVVAVWGVVSGALPALAQTLIMRLAGPERRSLAGALIPVLFNVGVAAGAGLASFIVAGTGVGSLPLIASGIVALGATGQAVLMGRRAV